MTVAIDVDEELHVPPDVESVNVMLAPVQTELAPEIAAGADVAVTVTALVTTEVPQLLVTE